MNNQHSDLVIFSMSSYWEWIQRGLSNRNFQLLKQLRQRPEFNKVLSIDFLPFTLKRALRTIFIDRKIKAQTVKSKVKGVYQIDDNFYVWSTILSYLNEKRLLKELQTLLTDLNFKDWVLWSYNPMFVQCFNFTQPKLKIFDTVDDWRQHPNYKKYQKRLTKNYQLINKNADIIFTVAKDLKNIYQQQEKVHWIPNGVEINHFQKLDNINKQNQARQALKNIKKPIIGYIGIIQERLDFELIKFLVGKNPNYSFVFLGWIWKGVKSTVEDLKNKYKNIYFLNKIDYQDLPYYLNHFDIGIVPHKVDEFTVTMNPLKFYEYLAVGLPVVSTRVAGTEIFQNRIEIAENYRQFSQQLNSTVNNLENLKKQKILKQEFIKQFSWEKRIEEMLKKIRD